MKFHLPSTILFLEESGSGGIGRRNGFKPRFPLGSEGSSPFSRTSLRAYEKAASMYGMSRLEASKVVVTFIWLDDCTLFTL